MDVVFATPSGALVAAVVLVPLAAGLVRERRAARLRRALVLAAPAHRARLPAALATVAVVALLAVAAAQPALRERRAAGGRSDAQAFFVFDVSRSMSASHGRDGATRLARAKRFALQLRRALGDVPAGVGSLTNRVLPNLFPSSDTGDFTLVVGRAVAVGSPVSASSGAGSTNFQALGQLATQGYFAPKAQRRLVVLMTDGESARFDASTVAAALDRSHVDLMLVRFWRPDERIYRRHGDLDPAYRPDEAAAASVGSLARVVARAAAFDEGDLAAATAAARRLLGNGPADPAEAGDELRPLSPYAVVAASLPMAFLLFGRGRPPARRRRSPRSPGRRRSCPRPSAGS